MTEVVYGTGERVGVDTSQQENRLTWIPIDLKPFLWKPAELEPTDLGWFINLLEASLQSEYQGYLLADNPETLWRIAGAKHPESWRLHRSKVLAHFEPVQMHGHQWLYFPPIVKKVKEQKKKLQAKRSRFPKNQQQSSVGAGFSLPLIFDSDVGVGSKTKKDGCASMESDERKSARRIIEMFGLPATDGNLKAIEEAVIAESKYTGYSFQEAAEQITKAARDDRDCGISINKFYFEDAKWRDSHGRNSKPSASEQRAERSRRNIFDGVTKAARRANAPDSPER